MLNKDMLNALIEIAEMIANYRNELIKQGLSESDALKLTISYQVEMQRNASFENIEREKMMLLKPIESKH